MMEEAGLAFRSEAIAADVGVGGDSGEMGHAGTGFPRGRGGKPFPQAGRRSVSPLLPRQTKRPRSRYPPATERAGRGVVRRGHACAPAGRITGSASGMSGWGV